MTETMLSIGTPKNECGLSNTGKLVPNTEAKVVDLDNGMPLPANIPGELFIRGPSVCYFCDITN